MRVESKVENTWNYLLVQKVGTKEQEKKKEDERREKEKLEFEQAVGISNILKKIINSVSIITHYKYVTCRNVPHKVQNIKLSIFPVKLG